MKYQKFITTCAIFLFSLFWIVLLFQGLPISHVDDWDKIIIARETPWDQFALTFLTPWSQSRDWVWQRDPYDEVHYKRIVLPMLLKLSQQWFGLNPFAMYFLTKGLFFSGCVAIVFLFLAQVVPLLYAILGTLAFLFVPAHYSHALWIADSATICYFLLFLGVWIFYTIQQNILKRGSNKQYQGLLLALFLTGWFGIRAKEPMLVLPLVVFLYSLFQFRHWRQAPVKFLALNVAMAIVAFQIIPVTHLNNGALPITNFNLETIGRLFFRNYECGYDNETVSAFFSWDHVFPVSVARTLGFFALWGFVISLGVITVRKWILKTKDMVPFWGHPLVRICGIWFLVELSFLGMFPPDPRFFSGTMAPILVLLVRLIYCAITGSAMWVRSALFVLWGIALGFNVSENFQNSLSRRIMVGRRLNYFQKSAQIILRDLRDKKVVNDLDVGRFYCSLNNGGPEFKEIKGHICYMGLDYDFGNEVIKGALFFGDFLNKAKLEYRYYAGFSPTSFYGAPGVKLIGTVEGINRASLLECIMFDKKKQPAVFKLYKFNNFDSES